MKGLKVAHASCSSSSLHGTPANGVERPSMLEKDFSQLQTFHLLTLANISQSRCGGIENMSAWVLNVINSGRGVVVGRVMVSKLSSTSSSRRRVASPGASCSQRGHRLGLNSVGLSFVSSYLVAIWTDVAFGTILHVIFVDTKSFVDFGTESIVVVNPGVPLVK
jgi:hypothetical protein